MSKKQKILSSNFWGENMTFKNLFQYLADLNSGSVVHKTTALDH